MPKVATFVGIKQGGIRIVAWEANTEEQSAAFFKALRYADEHCVGNKISITVPEGIRLIDETEYLSENHA